MASIKIAAVPSGEFVPRFFNRHEYTTLQQLCDIIIPADEHSGGARQAGVPEFIDLLTSENRQYQVKLCGGMRWLDAKCRERYGKIFLDCTNEQRSALLDLLAYKESVATHPDLSHGVAFFSLLRNLTTDGFFTSGVGIDYLQYIGNGYLAEFPGCPPSEDE